MSKYDPVYIEPLDVSFNKNTTLHLFWIGFILYSIGFTTSSIPNPNYMLSDILRLVGIVLFFPSLFLLLKFNFDNVYLKFIYILYIPWLALTVLRGFSFDYNFLKTTLFNPFNGFFLYLAPLALLFDRSIVFYKILFRYIIILGIIYIAHLVLNGNHLLNQSLAQNRDMLEIFAKSLAFPSGFILLTGNYHSNKSKVIAFLVLIITLLFSVYMARRGLVFIISILLIFSAFMYMYRNKDKFNKVLLLISIGLIITIIGYGSVNFKKLEFFDFISERINDDSRGLIEEYYYEDMNNKDWIIGRGMRGLIAAPLNADMDLDHPGYRDGIETDYLTIILKGGVISLGLLLLIAIPAMIKGLFFSSNSLSKAAGFWILTWLLSLYPSTVTTFTMNYLLVWISIGICYSGTIRNLPEDKLVSLFRPATDTIYNSDPRNAEESI